MVEEIELSIAYLMLTTVYPPPFAKSDTQVAFLELKPLLTTTLKRNIVLNQIDFYLSNRALDT